MIKSVVDGCIPKSVFAQVEIKNLNFNYLYRVEGTKFSSPLKEVTYKNYQLFNLKFSGNWFLDLKAQELENLDFVRSHGRKFDKNNQEISPESKNAITHWYLHPHDKKCIITSHKFHRLPEETLEKFSFKGPSIKYTLSKQLLSLPEQKFSLLFDDVSKIKIKGNEVSLKTKSQEYKYIICFDELAKKVKQRLKLQVKIKPDITQPATYLIKDKERELVVNIGNIPDDLGEAELNLYGCISLKKKVYLNKEGYSLRFKIKPKFEGIIPLLLFIEGKDFIFTRIFEIFVLPTRVLSPDHHFNGIFVEYLRSMHQRHIFNVVPEEDPRGMMVYHYGFWPRNLYSYNLFCFGFNKLGLQMIKTFGFLLEKYRFLFDAYSLRGEEIFSNPLVSISNDGIGFYLFQTGKILLRDPGRFDSDFKRGIELAIKWLNYSTHWNGLLMDKTEAVDHCRSERLSGNPYSQGICMAGLKITSKAMRLIEEEKLAQEAEELFERQIKGFKELYKDLGYFRDITFLNSSNLFSSYSMSSPGDFLLDPEVEELSLRKMIKKTAEIIRKNNTEEDNPYLISDKRGSVGMSYSQLGMVAALINLGNISEAWRFLKEILPYALSTNLKYVLPEGIILFSKKDDKLGEKMREKYYKVKEFCQKRAPHLFNERSEKMPGWPYNPGNLVHMSYYLFVVDLICGVFHKNGKEKLSIYPKIPPDWDYFILEEYRTRFGPVSYQYKRKKGSIEFELKKPFVETEVILGSLPQIKEVKINGKKIHFQSLKTPEGIWVKMNIKEEDLTVKIICKP